MFAPDPGPLPLLTDARPRRPVGPGPREAWGERLSRVVGIGCGRFTSCWRTRRPGGPGVLPSGPLEVRCSSTTRAPEIMCDLAAFPEKCVMFMHKTARNFRDSRTPPPQAGKSGPWASVISLPLLVFRSEKARTRGGCGLALSRQGRGLLSGPWENVSLRRPRPHVPQGCDFTCARRSLLISLRRTR